MNSIPPVLQELADKVGGTIESVSGPLSDGSGFATMSMPLPADHWLTAEHYNEPPMPFRLGAGIARNVLAQQIREAAKYAIRASTMNGKEIDFDAMVQNFVVGLLGYWTHDGTNTGQLEPKETGR